MENVASMDYNDCALMNEAYNEDPWYIDAGGVSLARRPRLYWVSWELEEEEGAEFFWGSAGQLPVQGEVVLKAAVESPKFLEPTRTCSSHLHYFKAESHTSQEAGRSQHM